MSSFQPYPEKKTNALLDLAVTTQSKVFLWSSGGAHQHFGKVLQFTHSAGTLALSVQKDKAFHEIIEKNYIDEIFVMMQVGKDQVYFKALIRSGDDVSWSFHVASPFFKLERRTSNRAAVAADMASAANVVFGEGAPGEFGFRGAVRDLSRGGVAVLGRETEIAEKVPVGLSGRVRFVLGTLPVEGEFVVTHTTPIESRRLGKKRIVGMRFTRIDEKTVAEIAKFVARF